MKLKDHIIYVDLPNDLQSREPYGSLRKRLFEKFFGSSQGVSFYFRRGVVKILVSLEKYSFKYFIF